MYFSSTIVVILPSAKTYDDVIAVGQSIYPNRSVIRCFRNRITNHLHLIVESALSVYELAQLTHIPVENMEQLTSTAPYALSCADQYLNVHPELVPEYPNGIATATFLQ